VPDCGLGENRVSLQIKNAKANKLLLDQTLEGELLCQDG